MAVVRERQICYHQLRAMVIATSRYASSIEEYASTFSEGNASHDYQNLALYLDELVADSEPEQQFLVVHQEDIFRNQQAASDAYEATLKELDEEMEASQEKTVFIDRIRVALGVIGLPQDAVLGMIKTMQEDIDRYEKAAEKAAKGKSKKK